MPEAVRTIKLCLNTNESDDCAFRELTERYAEACTYISKYVFEHGFIMNFMKLQNELYSDVRNQFGLKAQMTISSLKTVTARYKTVKEQLAMNPYHCKVDGAPVMYFQRTLEWLQKPIVFRRPQADLVRGRDYSFVQNGEALSINTLSKRVVVKFEKPAYFNQYFDGTWKLGTGKLVSMNGKWYFHIPATKDVPEMQDDHTPEHVVGIDRGLRFIATTYDENGKTKFVSGKSVMKKRDKFAQVRAELQSRGTKSAKRRLKALSGRENRWMSDINHQISKTLVNDYGENTLFVVEDLTGVSFDEANLSKDAKANNQLRTWSFYQLEQFLSYKAIGARSKAIKVVPDYTSQRCPKCGRILKENRNHKTHEYVCDCCGYRSNDDRVGAMNIQLLGTMYVSGDTNPRFGSRKQ